MQEDSDDSDDSDSSSRQGDSEEEKFDNIENDDLIDTKRKTGHKSRREFDLSDHLAPMSSSRNGLLGSRQKYRDDFN